MRFPVVGLFVLPLAASLLAPRVAAADWCHNPEIWPPETARLPTNPQLVLSGRVGDELMRLDIEESGLALRSASETVPLAVRVAYDHGGAALNREHTSEEVVVAPVRALAPGTEYRLVYTRKAKARSCGDLGAPRPEAQLPHPRWTTTSGPDRVAPAWPEETAGVEPPAVRTFDCGPLVELPPNHAREWLLVRAIVHHPASGWTSMHLVPPSGDFAFLGLARCGSLFGLEKGESYQAVVWLVDLAGNESDRRFIDFTVPAGPTSRPEPAAAHPVRVTRMQTPAAPSPLAALLVNLLLAGVLPFLTGYVTVFSWTRRQRRRRRAISLSAWR
jgi:hypothetical protein